MAQPIPYEPTQRDRAVLLDLRRVRLLTGRQLERLHFVGFSSANARGSARRRSLARLAAAGLVTTLPRRVGGERAGSAGLVYALDAAGHRLLEPGDRQRTRRPWPVGWPFVQHTLDVSELYARLREAERLGQLRLVEFATEPDAWFQAGCSVLKPDAWTVYETTDWERHLWLEVDRGTESLPTLDRKLRSYLEFASRGHPGPLGVVPRVVLTVPNVSRRTAVQGLLDALPPPADQLFRVVLHADLFQPTPRPPP